MPKVVFVAPDGSRREIELVTGMSLMQGAVQNNVREIFAECGGSCSCATCHVYIDAQCAHLLPKRAEMEDEMLEGVAAPRLDTSRLGCQITITPALDGLIVHLPSRQA